MSRRRSKIFSFGVRSLLNIFIKPLFKFIEDYFHRLFLYIYLLVHREGTDQTFQIVSLECVLYAQSHRDGGE